jgi:transcriptional regulator GlxA family with amidase domain
MRFERACDQLLGPGRPTFARVAADTGYVDQAHLSRDFRALAGTTATAWLAERLPG